MEREEINLDKEAVRDSFLYCENNEIVVDKESGEEYKLIEDKITHSDAEDGGADHEMVIQRTSDKKYFRKHYTDWDVDYNFERDFNGYFQEVFPKSVTIITFN